ncbi:discoidin domain-containing protein [Pyxidicoccus xibeiensis]|uniref:discoidin domain-containing protein n=1 Tax=Pyxidicoccus xibeiensis TaxID=2906759 RepID=UPI0020A6EF97|nr:discoidin domain-containing protein [Pyxidicoccus xibeiensis]MCP3136961.1 discoidin domain-containing protein [Pyxidicoccus xibeiensis]
MASLVPLLALLTALPAQANEQAPPASQARERALLEVLHPPAKGAELEEGEVTPGRFLVKLDTVVLDTQREAVLVVTSGQAPGEYEPLRPGLEAELAVVRGVGKALTVLSRERVPTPSGVGEYQASVSTALDGKKGEKVILVDISSHNDGEGSGVALTFFQFLAGTGKKDGVLERIMEDRYTPSSGSGYPHEREDAAFDTQPSVHEGYSDLSLRVSGHYCDTDEECRSEKRVERICWEGTRYSRSDDCLVRVVTTSSELKSGKADAPTYDSDNVRDGEDSTAWCEGAKGTGRGEWLKFTFNTPVTVGELTLVAGYNKSPEVWRRNARLKRVRLHFSDGTRQDADLDDSASPQDILLETKSALESVKLEVLAVYPGSRHADACVSEVDFSDVQAAPPSPAP